MNTTKTQQNAIEEFEIVCNETAALVPVDPDREAIVRALASVVKRLEVLPTTVYGLEVTDETSLRKAEYIMEEISDLSKLTEDALSEQVSKAFQTHRRWTGLKGLLLNPLGVLKTNVKRKVIFHQETVIKAADAQRRKLQAEADEKARREREALEKKAAEAKRPETQEKHREAAELVAAPIINVEVPKTSVRINYRWTAEVKNFSDFFKAISDDSQHQGFVKVELSKLARAKSANDRFEVPGIVFRKVAV